LFFFLDKKEPKNQDLQKKFEKSTARSTEILKLTASWRFIQKESLSFRLPEFFQTFSEGRF
jgi:hypothetical protein